GGADRSAREGRPRTARPVQRRSPPSAYHAHPSWQRHAAAPVDLPSQRARHARTCARDRPPSRAAEAEMSDQTRAPEGPWSTLGDFTTNRRIIPISLIAIAIATLSAFLARALLALIPLLTTLPLLPRRPTAPP